MRIALSQMRKITMTEVVLAVWVVVSISFVLYLRLVHKQTTLHNCRQMATIKGILAKQQTILDDYKKALETMDKALLVQKATIEKQHNDLVAVKGSITLGKR
jgi:cell division protein FtsL